MKQTGASPDPLAAELEMAWIREQWPLVASLAWTGYVDEGRGAVVVDQGAHVAELHYKSGPVWEDPASNVLVQVYKPRREVVLAIVRGTEATVQRIEAPPFPPDAVITHPIERLRPNARLEKRAQPDNELPDIEAAGDIDPTLINEPLVPGDAIVGLLCPFCQHPLEVGDLTRWVCVGPANRREYGKARRGLPYMSRSPWPFHYDCGNPKGRGVPTNAG